MVELLKDAGDSPRLNTIFSGIAALGVVVMMLTVLVGWLASTPMNKTTTRCLNPWQSEAGRRAEPTTRHCDYLPETKKRNVGVALGYSGSVRQAALQEFSLEDMREAQTGAEVDAVVFKAKCQEAGHPVATG